MNINNKVLYEIYFGVSSDYNKSPLATNEGWIYKPSEFGFIELMKVANYLPEKNARLLDIGTGMGIVPIATRRLGASVISVDSIDASGRSAIRNVERFGVLGQFCDICVDKLPLDDNSVDCVFWGDVIEHLIHSPKQILEEMYRVLKPGGVCIATTPNATRLTVRIRVLLGYSNWANINVVISNVADIPTQGRCKKTIIKEKMIFVILKNFFFAIASLFPNLRSNMLLVARKETISNSGGPRCLS